MRASWSSPVLTDLPRPLLSVILGWLVVFLALVMVRVAPLLGRGLPWLRRCLAVVVRIISPWLRIPKIPAPQWCALISGCARRTWGANCLVQAVAAEAVLRYWHEPVQLRIGVRSDESGFAAHAWLTARRQMLIGGTSASEFRELQRGVVLSGRDC